MTQKEKAEMLKDTITFLYEKESRSKTYISNLLQIERKILSQLMDEWSLVKGDERHLPPSKEKFLNANRRKIIDMLSDITIPMKTITSELKISQKSLVNCYIRSDKELMHHYMLRKTAIEQKKHDLMNKSSRIYDFEPIEGETWKEILGYSEYEISNKGRVRSYVKRYQAYYLLRQNENIRSGRMYVCLYKDGQRKNISVSRLVGHMFVDGFSEENNTINHINGDVKDNTSENLEWVSQRINNVKAHLSERMKSIPYEKNGRFKEIILDEKYHFKTISALARFLNVSVTQAGRYIDKECASDHTFRFVY